MAPSDNQNLLQRCLDGASGPRAWTSTSRCLSDHFAFAASHYDLLGAYTGIGAPSIEPPLVEAIMVAVNSVNQCPYCDGLHGELARLVGLGDAAVELRGCKDASSAAAAMKSVTVPSVVPAVKYARIAGEADGKGAKEAAAYAALVDAEGASRAASIKALCLFLIWGSMTGNTINTTKKRLIGVSPLSGLTLFSSLFTLYYGPLFLVVFTVNTLISCLPRMASQTWFFKV